jgi:hypothetical protein
MRVTIARTPREVSLQMMRHIPASNFYRRIACFVLFFMTASASFQGFYQKWHFREAGVVNSSSQIEEQRFGLAEMLDGTASRPYVYRQLLPTFANWVNQITPIAVQQDFYRWEGHDLLPQDIRFNSAMAGDSRYFFRYLVIYAATFLFAFFSMYCMYLVCCELGYPPAACIFAPVVLMLIFPYFESGGGFLYDYPELAFLALSVWISLRLHWVWLLPLAALGTWNKESFLLILITLYPLLRKRNSKAGAIVATASLVLASALVLFGLHLHYRQNPGVTVLFKWRNQAKFFIHPLHWINWEQTYGIAHFRAFSLVPLALIAWTAWRGWKLLSTAMKSYAKLVTAINLPLFLFFCMPGEMRDFSLLYVVFLALLASNITVETQLRDQST